MPQLGFDVKTTRVSGRSWMTVTSKVKSDHGCCKLSSSLSSPDFAAATASTFSAADASAAQPSSASLVTWLPKSA